MQEFQGLHVAVSRRVVDSVGSALEVGEGEFQDLAVTFTPKIMLKNPALWECACSRMIWARLCNCCSQELFRGGFSILAFTFNQSISLNIWLKQLSKCAKRYIGQQESSQQSNLICMLLLNVTQLILIIGSYNNTQLFSQLQLFMLWFLRNKVQHQLFKSEYLVFSVLQVNIFEDIKDFVLAFVKCWILYWILNIFLTFFRPNNWFEISDYKNNALVTGGFCTAPFIASFTDSSSRWQTWWLQVGHYEATSVWLHGFTADTQVYSFTLSWALISAPFLINTSMIWMLPHPAAMRRGGVPCCNQHTWCVNAHGLKIERPASSPQRAIKPGGSGKRVMFPPLKITLSGS